MPRLPLHAGSRVKNEDFHAVWDADDDRKPVAHIPSERPRTLLVLSGPVALKTEDIMGPGVISRNTIRAQAPMTLAQSVHDIS